MKASIDFVFQHEGSISILYPLTESAKQWIDENIDPNHQSWGKDGVVIEHRYIYNIINGIQDDGLTVKI